MTKDNFLIIERVQGVNGGIMIRYDTAVERYLGYSLKDAERKFRQDYNLVGKRLHRICT